VRQLMARPGSADRRPEGPLAEVNPPAAVTCSARLLVSRPGSDVQAGCAANTTESLTGRATAPRRAANCLPTSRPVCTDHPIINDTFLSLNQKFSNLGRRASRKRHGSRGCSIGKRGGSDHDEIVPCIGVEFNYLCCGSSRPGAVASADRS